MRLKLWHYTWPDNFGPIQREGFKDLRGRRCVFFVNAGDTGWESWGEPIEVVLELTEEEIRTYRQYTIYDEMFDEASGRYVKTDNMTEIAVETTYQIPFELVNARRLELRRVPQEEHRRQFSAA